MPAGLSKLRLSILLLFLQLFVYLYVVPRDAGPQEVVEDVQQSAQDFPLEADCRTTYPRLRERECLSGNGYFKGLAENCGITPEPLFVPEKKEEPIEPLPVEEETTPSPEINVEVKVNLTEEPLAKVVVKEQQQRPQRADKADQDTDKASTLIYQLIVVLLFLSVSFALADCFQERAKKRANPDCGGRQDGLSRRMSLADLTMSRHARKESQASYRPLGEKRPLLATRSCSHEVPLKTKAVTRQTSCPQFDDDPLSGERRRVRMIQRH